MFTPTRKRAYCLAKYPSGIEPKCPQGSPRTVDDRGAGDHLTSAIETPSPTRHDTRLKFSEDWSINMRKHKSEAAHGWVREECFQEENSMSSPIAPLQNPAGGAPVRTSTAADRPGVSTASFATALNSSVALDAIPSSPPPEILDQMASAAQTYERLSSQGRELRFAREEPSGRMTIEVRDRRGNVLRRLSPAQALEVAAGAPLE
jgi:hypothetical protein